MIFLLLLYWLLFCSFYLISSWPLIFFFCLSLFCIFLFLYLFFFYFDEYYKVLQLFPKRLFFYSSFLLFSFSSFLLFFFFSFLLIFFSSFHCFFLSSFDLHVQCYECQLNHFPPSLLQSNSNLTPHDPPHSFLMNDRANLMWRRNCVSDVWAMIIAALRYSLRSLFNYFLYTSYLTLF